MTYLYWGQPVLEPGLLILHLATLITLALDTHTYYHIIQHRTVHRQATTHTQTHTRTHTHVLNQYLWGGVV